MEITTRKLPASIGINAIQKGVYEFDMDVLHLGVPGFIGEYAIKSADVQAEKQYLYLRVGQERYPEPIRRHELKSFILGKFTRMWVDGSTIKGHVVIPQHHYGLFDAIVDATGGTLYVGVCSLVQASIRQGEQYRVIQELWGAQILTADGYNLAEMSGESHSPLYAITLKAAAGTRDYIEFCANSIASEPYVPPVKQVQPTPVHSIEDLPIMKDVELPSLAEHVAKEKAEPFMAHSGIVIADAHVKGQDESMAKLAAKETAKPYGEIFLTVPETKKEDGSNGA